MKEMSGGSGVVGAPQYGSAAKGKRIEAAVVAKLRSIVLDIRGDSAIYIT
jgi:creatinine amidohydrolase/Fe(II)-dependent formamide hydrolase-like protein